MAEENDDMLLSLDPVEPGTEGFSQNPADMVIPTYDNVIGSLGDGGVEDLTVEQVQKFEENKKLEGDDPNKSTDGTDTPPAGNPSPVQKTGTFNILAQDLIKSGILSAPEEGEEINIEDEDQFKSLIESNQVKGAQEIFENWKQGLRPDQKKYLDLIDQDIESSVAMNIADKIGLYSSMTDDKLEDETVAEKLLRDSYAEQGVDKKIIDVLVQRSKDLSTLVEDAKTAKPVLLSKLEEKETAEKEKVKVVEKQNVERRENYWKKVKEDITSAKEVFPGIAGNDKIKQALYDIISKPVAVNANGQPVNAIQKLQIEHPNEVNKILAYLVHTKVLSTDANGKFKSNLDTFKKSIETKIVGDLEKQLNLQEASKGGKPSDFQGPDDKSTEDNLFAGLEKAYGGKTKSKYIDI